jgi:N-sulfoglucosamine sulfohydrolase
MKNTVFLILFCLLGIAAIKSSKPKAKQPNIVWIVCEDMSPHLGSYGEKVAKTPVLDQLASEGVRYTNVFSTAGVCAPSRCALITGCYQTSMGGQHMRTSGASAAARDAYPADFKSYSACVPPDVKCFSEYLRQAGYYCTNNSKQDYQFEPPPTAWDESSRKAHWRNRKDKNQPFFAVFNLEVTHESQVWVRDKEPLLVNPKDVEVPPYYPDDSISRKAIARFLSNVMVMDKQVGDILQQLKDEKLYDDTIIFFYSDHGDGMPYVKRELHHRGLRVPLIIKSPFSSKGTVDNQLVSFVDFAPSVLSLAGVPVPKSIQGQAFIGNEKAKKPRQYIYAARDRMDSEYDRVRAVSDGRFNYLKNYMPQLPYYQNIRYRLQNPLMPHILQLKEAGKLNEKQAYWFRQSKPDEELFDTQTDPFEMTNLANSPQYSEKLKELRAKHTQWLNQYKDWGAMPEMQMVKLWWNDKETPPKTAEPLIEFSKNKVKIASNTEGVSIGYRKSLKDTWTVYQKPFIGQKGDSLYVVAHRIGYEKTVKSFKL